MAVTLEMIHKDMQRIRSEVHLLRDVIEWEWRLSNKAHRELDKAREEMAKGEYVTHEDVMDRYG